MRVIKGLLLLIILPVAFTVLVPPVVEAAMTTGRPTDACDYGTLKRSKSFYANKCYRTGHAASDTYRYTDGSSTTLLGDVLPQTVLNRNSAGRIPSRSDVKDALHGVNTKAELITYLKGHNDSGNNRRERASAFIVHTMLGRDAAATNALAGSGRFNIRNSDWNLLTAYLNHPLTSITWHANIDVWQNTMGLRRDATPNILAGDVNFTSTTLNNQDVIRIRYGGQFVYGIRRECANPVNNGPGFQNVRRATLAASADGNKSVNVGTEATFRFRVNASDKHGVPADQKFRWRIVNVTNGNVWPDRNTNIRGSNPRVDRTITRTFNTAGQRCFSIRISNAGTPNWVYRSPQRAQQCITWSVPPNGTGDMSVDYVGGGEFEKGDDITKLEYHSAVATVSRYPCDNTEATGANVDISWSTAAIGDLGSTGSGTISLGGVNCMPIGPPVPVLIPLADFTADATHVAGVNSKLPGIKVGRSITVDFSLGTFTAVTSEKETTVIEAPFARFFGNDVLVCGEGEHNRFAFDDITPDYRKGSFSEFASIFTGTNNPAHKDSTPKYDYWGLPGAGGLSTQNADDYLTPNWGAATCGNSAPGDDDFVVSETTVENASNYDVSAMAKQNVNNTGGDITITANIVSNLSVADPTAYRVYIIKAFGDINIAKGVNRIDAILVAGGNINTCTDADGSPIGSGATTDRSLIDEQCSNPLKINGSLVTGGDVKLQRVGGTRYLANMNTSTWKGVAGGGNSDADNASASEIIEYPWQLNFANPKLKNTSIGGFDAYYSKSPRL